MWIELFLKRAVFAPEDGTGTGDDTAPVGDDTIAGDDTAPADDDLITDGDDTGSDDDDLFKTDDSDAAAFNDEVLEFNEETFAEDFADILPEGFQPDAEGFSEFLKGFNEAGSRRDMLKHALDTFKEYIDSSANASTESWNSMIADWKKETREHPEYGGANLEASLANAKLVAKTYGGKEFFDFLKLTGTSNHPAMVAFLNKVHAEMPDEPTSHPSGEKTSTAEKSLADRLYGL